MQGAQASNRNRGIGRYSTSLTQAILRNNSEHEIVVVLSAAFADTIDPIKDDLHGLISPENICIWHPICPASHIDDNNDHNRKIAQCHREAFLASLTPDLVLVTSLFEGLVDDAITSVSERSNLPTAVVLYDLIPFINQEVYLENPVVLRWYSEKIEYLKQADLLLAISQSSANEAIDYLGFNVASVVNISTAAEKHFKPTAISSVQETQVRNRYGLLQNFVMYTGGIDQRKNIEGLIKAYANLSKDLRKEHQLAIVCSIQPEAKEKLTQLSKSVGLDSSEIVFTGFVPEEDLVALYNLSTLFVFPSWHEGFGLPALEAMQCGKPVIAANTSSLPEVVGLYEALFDPLNEQSITDKLQIALTDKNFRNHLAQHGLQQAQKFSWDETAIKALEAIENRFSQNKKQAASLPTVKHKLAFISPLPPERSGISDYSAELLRVLIVHYNIEVIVNQETVSDAWIVQNCTVRTVEYFQNNYNTYERVIYHFGNSHFHTHMFGLLSEYPGLVVLHDFFLSGIQAHRDINCWQPNAWANSLYQSHGYNAVKKRFQTSDIADVIWEYPCNLPVLQDALGIIVHSENSILLAKKWYTKDAADDWSVIPHLRTPAPVNDKNKIREKYGYQPTDILICSFGMIGKTKLNHRLLECFLTSNISQNEPIHLVFVGSNDQGEYGQNLIQKINSSRLAHRIKITGWADETVFKDYLAMADIGVQLRTLSRGETSGTVLDCMNFELPTIVNAHGSMADLDESGVLMLPDDFNDSQLSSALLTLIENEELRRSLGKRAKEIITTKHDPKSCAEQYALAIESFYVKNKVGLFGLTGKLAGDGLVNELNVMSLSSQLQKDFPPSIRKKQLLVDVSELIQRDAKSGIQRVVRNILHEWFLNPPEGYLVEPVYATSDKQGYLYARKFTCQFLDMPYNWIVDEPIDAWQGDIFVALDLQPYVLQVQSNFLKSLNSRGVRIKTVIYDLLPVLLPHVFVEGAQPMHQAWLETTAKFDGVVCISKAVADEYLAWLLAHNIKTKKSFSVDWFHLGADIEASQSTKGLPANAKQLIDNFKHIPSFLMVGTLEPRKGHAQTLQAFEQLWAKGLDVNLVMVGKQGWMVENLIAKINAHPERNKRLFWLEGISDEFLEQIYRVSTCLIAASEGEGFGLPLIEAAQKKLPIIARDIPVFKEVAGEYAYYFENTLNPEVIEATIQDWLELYKTNQHPKSDTMPWLTWEESAKKILRVLIK
jgi:glycosyltransferase involved in cell wall biosynthesis